MPGGITYKELTKLIEKLSSKKTSGTLFLRTEDNHSGMVMFRAGAVIGLTYGVSRGLKAIEEIRNISDGAYFTYRFQEGRPPPIRQDLKSPEETLIALGVMVETSLESLAETPAETPAASAIPVSDPAPEPKPDAPPPPASDASAKTAAALAADADGSSLEMDGLIRNILTEEMLDHLGPAAELIISDAESAAGGLSNRRQVDRVLEALGQDLEAGEREDFMRAIRERTSSLFTKTACTLVTGELNEYVGPVAATMCNDQIQRMGGGISCPEELQQLVNALAGEIDDPAESRRFIERVEDGLRKISS